jgi:hypothetical protein
MVWFSARKFSLKHFHYPFYYSEKQYWDKFTNIIYESIVHILLGKIKRWSVCCILLCSPFVVSTLINHLTRSLPNLNEVLWSIVFIYSFLYLVSWNLAYLSWVPKPNIQNPYAPWIGSKIFDSRYWHDSAPTPLVSTWPVSKWFMFDLFWLF